MRAVGLVLLVLGLAACAPRYVGYGGEDAPQQVVSACRFEAESRADMGATPGLRTMAGQEFDRGMRLGRLMDLCMGSRGYQRR